MFNIPKFERPHVNPELYMNLRDPDEVTNNILTFLREQSKNAERQFKTSRNLIIATIAIMILQIFIAGFSIAISNSEQNNLTEIIDTQSKQSEVISRMSLSLLDLGNQVRTLKQENARLNQKLSK
nr:hypothetical protein BACT7_26230 [Tenacibaculum mesophilum]BFF41183.1 hypothetical protein BACY1_29880 [Tenacibaculum mesophilum]